MRKPELTSEFCGKELASPIGVGSQALFSPGGHRISTIISLLREYVSLGAGFVCTPCIRSGSDDGPPATGRFQVSHVGGEVLGYVCVAERRRIQLTQLEGTTLISELRRCLPRTPVIANIVAETGSTDEWVEHAVLVARAGASFIEINPSCPLPTGHTQSGGGDALFTSQLGDEPDALGEIVSAVAEAVSVPVGVKVSGEWSLKQVLRTHSMLVSRGLAFSTNVNSPLTVAPPSIRDVGAGRYPGLRENPLGAATGPWVRFLAYRNTALLSSYFPSLEIAAVGGVTSAENVLELILLGARTVQLSSSLMLDGRRSLREMTLHLQDLLIAAGCSSVADAYGRARFDGAPVTDWGLGRLEVVFDAELCVGCQECAGSICQAIDAAQIPPSVNQADCGLCGLCVARCRTGAITICEKSRSHTD